MRLRLTEYESRGDVYRCNEVWDSNTEEWEKTDFRWFGPSTVKRNIRLWFTDYYKEVPNCTCVCRDELYDDEKVIVVNDEEFDVEAVYVTEWILTEDQLAMVLMKFG